MSRQQQVVAGWLRSKIRERQVGYFLSSAAILAMAVIVLLVTWWAIYMTLLFVSMLIPHSENTRMMLSVVILLFLFVADYFDPRPYVDEIRVETPSGRPPVTMYLPGIGVASTINPLAPGTMNAFVKIGATVVTAGPRMLMATGRLLGRGLSLGTIDVDASATVLLFLAKRAERVPYEEIVDKLPPQQDVAKLFIGLRLLDAVLFLKSKPPGLKLMENWQQEIATTLTAAKKAG